MTITVTPATTRVATHCPYCALQCGQWVGPGGEVDGREFPTNRGGLCQKGWTSGSLLGHPERLTSPLLRTSRSEPLAPTGWDAALGHVVSRIRALQDEHGPDAVGNEIRGPDGVELPVVGEAMDTQILASTASPDELRYRYPLTSSGYRDY